ncbi:helicase-associated domain-containing protein [Streptomyces sirii]|uniref:helicase-associated domain-containing protein n=1 Tax=Streptomyces sirii TaxID=3127701 RepID=UPI003D35BFD3
MATTGTRPHYGTPSSPPWPPSPWARGHPCRTRHHPDRSPRAPTPRCAVSWRRRTGTAPRRQPAADGRGTRRAHPPRSGLSGAGRPRHPHPLGRALLADPRSLDELLGDLLPPLLERAHFQADLTAVVPGRPAAALAGLLASAADRESEGHAVTWRFTPASVRRALDAGHSAGTLLDDLTRASTTGTLPQPLRYLVQDAARAHGRMRVLPAACCIRSDDESLVKELAAHRALHSLALRAIAPTVLVSSSPPAATLEALRAAGYAPALESDTGATTVERLPAHRTTAPTPTRDPHAPLTLARRLLGLSPGSQDTATSSGV